jgi:hypothetical protein
MSKKHDFLRKEQSRDKHPERLQTGSAAKETLAAKGEVEDFDKQQPGTGKVANDHNKMGNKAPTQTNQGQRTPQSRHDRQTMGSGPQNQVSARKGGGGAGRSPRGGG